MENNKKGGLFLLAAALGTAAVLATRTSAKEPDKGTHLDIYDEWGNAVPYSGPVGRGPVGAGSKTLVPGNYTAVISTTNTTHMSGGTPVGATLTINVSSDIAGLMTEINDAQAFTAGQTRSFTYPFTVTVAMMNQSGTITVKVLAPNTAKTQLATDSVMVNISPPATVLGTLAATKFYGTNTSSGVAIGTYLNLKENEAHWADVSLQYQYNGGNFSVYTEILVGSQAWRSYKDITLADVAVMTTVPVTTVNQDVFKRGALTFGQTANIRVSLIYRGDGTDWSLNQAAQTVTYTAAVRNIEPDYAPMIESVQFANPIGGAFINATSGMAIVYGNPSLAIKLTLRAQGLVAPAAIGSSSSFTLMRPGTSLSMTKEGSDVWSGSIASGWTMTLTYTVNSALTQYGSYNVTGSVMVNGVTILNGTLFTFVINEDVIYGAIVTIG